ncbi:prephenate dehydrogenase [Gallaecimonas kandeliae]|uniref:prephenate dehydrogenase n=1 Tax=Gallaecimonas kandeliae TaxID=3029055 RepID=UPI00264700A9|nr:prephenate dehydrogenase [Gallaecimonas kandeliae]WKE65016.1 prephenate dehydrogenase [Gallaecimonas kandeliae]
MNETQHPSLLQALRDSLKAAYQQALDADRKLDALASENLAQFETVLKPNNGFTVEATRFKPYVEELGQELIALEASQAFNTDLEKLTRKLGLLLQTLARFKTMA